MGESILHIDFDSFFASVEQQYNPKLRGKPLGVTAQNGRTCIIASSREAKKLGIKTGSRTFEARRICPSLLLVPADFVKYFEVSKKFLKICKDYSPYTEFFSIDEVFMDVTHSKHLFGDVFGIINTIKLRIREEIGEYITVSIGISYNKLLAKLASGFAKPARHASEQALRAGPNGVFEITPYNFDEVYKSAKLIDVCGIGERIKLRLNKIGVYTLMELKNTPLEILVREFGFVEAEFLHRIGFGIDNNPVIPYTMTPEVKSVGRNYCLPKNEYNKRVVLQNIYELCEEVGIKLRRLSKKAKTLGVSFRGNIDIAGQKTLGIYFDSGKEMFEACGAFLGKEFMTGPNEYIRQIGVWASHLVDQDAVQTSLFDYKSKTEKLQDAIDMINDRFGDHTIRNGFLLYADKLTTVPNGYGADKWERTKLAT